MQFNNVENQYGTLLDLVLANFDCVVHKNNAPLVPEDDYHPVLEIAFSALDRSTRTNFSSVSTKKYNFYKANFPLLYQLLVETDWNFLMDMRDVDLAVSAFYKQLYALLDQCVPLYKSRKNNIYRYPSWYTKNIIHELKEKSRLHRLWRETKSNCIYEILKRKRSTIKSLIDTAYSAFTDRAENSIKADPKCFWRYIHQKRNKSRIPCSMTLNGVSFDFPGDILNAFADYFSSVYVVSRDCSNLASPNYTSVVLLQNLCEAEVLESLTMQKNKLSSGYDQIPAFILKDCAHILTTPLLYIFNLSLKLHTFPSAWKLARVCPVHKSGDISDIANYRPISILPNFAKAFEFCIRKRIFSQIHRLLVVEQHGFFPGRSTISNLTSFMETAYGAIDDGCQLDCIYTDFSKAFDRLDFGIIIDKLSRFGFHPNLLHFFHSYLTNRPHFVEYNNYRSKNFTSTSGVPQGSVLAPLLFNLFINDIVSSMTCNALLFADDLKIFKVIRSVNDCLLLQKDLQSLCDWCGVNKLALNYGKCKKITISLKRHELNYSYRLGNTTLEDCASVIDLGVAVDKKLSFNCHINMICDSASKSLGFLVRAASQFKNATTLMALYQSFVKSKLQYASLIWSPQYSVHINRIERVQRRFLKYLQFKTNGIYPCRGFPHPELLEKFDLFPLEKHRDHDCQIFIYK